MQTNKKPSENELKDVRNNSEEMYKKYRQFSVRKDKRFNMSEVHSETEFFEKIKSYTNKINYISLIEFTITKEVSKDYKAILKEIDRLIANLFISNTVVKFGNLNYYILSNSKNISAFKISNNSKVVTMSNKLNIDRNAVDITSKYIDVRQNDLEDFHDVMIIMNELKLKPEYTDNHLKFDAILNSFKVALLECTVETEQHCARISYYNSKVAQKLSLTEEETNNASILGWLHDVGKIAIEDSILNKPARLNDVEWIRMEEHATIGWRILKDIPGFETVAEGVRHHHERYDGKGYPDSIEKDEIPLISRITSISDSFDTILSKRSYKESMSVEYALNELIENKGKQFDPVIVDVFIELVNDGEFNKIMETYGN